MVAEELRAVASLRFFVIGWASEPVDSESGLGSPHAHLFTRQSHCLPTAPPRDRQALGQRFVTGPLQPHCPQRTSPRRAEDRLRRPRLRRGLRQKWPGGTESGGRRWRLPQPLRCAYETPLYQPASAEDCHVLPRASRPDEALLLGLQAQTKSSPHWAQSHPDCASQCFRSGSP